LSSWDGRGEILLAVKSMFVLLSLDAWREVTLTAVNYVEASPLAQQPGSSAGYFGPRRLRRLVKS
jgi:hypothetical protein